MKRIQHCLALVGLVAIALVSPALVFCQGEGGHAGPEWIFDGCCPVEAGEDGKSDGCECSGADSAMGGVLQAAPAPQRGGTPVAGLPGDSVSAPALPAHAGPSPAPGADAPLSRIGLVLSASLRV